MKRNQLAANAFRSSEDYVQPLPERAGDEDFKRHWDRVVLTYPPEHFHDCDLVLLDTFVSLRLQYEKMEAQLRTGDLILDASHGPRLNPLVGGMTTVARQLTTLGRSLRLTPSSRLSQDSLRPDPLDHDPPDGDTSNRSHRGGLRLAG